MRKLLKFNILLVAGFTSILLVGFQNCAKYQYAATDLGGSNNGLNTDTLPDNSTSDVNQIPPVIGGGSSTPVDGGGSTMPPVVGGGSTMPPVVGGGENGGYEPPVGQPGTENPECISSGEKCYADHEEEDDDEDNDNDDDKKDLEKYCNNASEGKSSENHQNEVATVIKNGRGKLIITQDNIAHIDLIEDFRGKLILCGVSVDKISCTRGKIVLVDSQVTEMEDHKGTIKLIGNSGSTKVSYSKTKINIARRK